MQQIFYFITCFLNKKLNYRISKYINIKYIKILIFKNIFILTYIILTIETDNSIILPSLDWNTAYQDDSKVFFRKGYQSIMYEFLRTSIVYQKISAIEDYHIVF